MRFPRTARIFRGQLDASPFVGVLFLLAIFLLLNSSLVFMPGVAIRLPEAADLPGLTNPTVAVAVDRSGQLYFQSQVISEDDLRLRLRKVVASTREPISLVLLADESVPNGTLVRLSNLARESGVRDALLATRPPAPAAGTNGRR